MHLIDLKGKRFGNLRVIRRAGGPGEAHWLCECTACGSRSVIRGLRLRKGQRYCNGCRGRWQTKHGESTSGRSKPKPGAVYGIWQSMIQRCETPTHRAYKNYGGRGITVCTRWRESYTAFRDDMGPRPPGMQLERKNNDGPYSPENCRWATRREQNSNRRGNRYVTFREKRWTVTALAREVGLRNETLRYRLATGWPIEKAVQPPLW